MWRVGGGGGVVSSRVHAIDPGRYQLPTLYPVTLALTPSLWPGNALSLDMISLLYLFVTFQLLAEGEAGREVDLLDSAGR